MQTTQDIVSAPAVGAAWPGTTDIYAGIARGQDGAPDHHLVVVTGADSELKAATWASAGEWAQRIGAELPTRRELSLLYANVPELFESEWYWSGEQCAGDADCAWAQDFGAGDQNDCHKDGKFRARAVRRLTI